MEVIPYRRSLPNQTYLNRVNTVLGNVAGQKPARKKQRRRQRAPKFPMTRYINNLNHIQRTMRTFGQIATTAGGLVGLASIQSSQVTSCNDWTNAAQEFQMYRVRAIRLKLFPATTSSNSPTTYQLAVLFGRWWQIVPTTLTGMSSDPGAEVFSTLQEATFYTTNAGNIDGQEFTPVGTTITNPCLFGLTFVQINAVVGIVSSYMWHYTSEFLVEFKGTA
jgi:hypothetical protein